MTQRTSSGRMTPAASLWRATTFLSFTLAALLLFAFPAKGLHTHRRAHHHSRVERVPHKLVSRQTDWDLSKSRGQSLHCAMDGDQEAANQAVSSPISEWTDYGDVARYGWKLDEDAEIDDAMGQDLLEAAFEELNIDADKNEIIKIDQIVPVTVGGNEYEPSGAEYKCLFNADAGMIVVDNVRSPEHAKKDSTPMSAIVPLRQCIMRQAIGEADDFNDWDDYSPMETHGKTFRPGSDEYYALLYCPNGRGIGWLLTQHKAQMGLLTVSSITVFGADGDAMLYFKIDPVEQND